MTLVRLFAVLFCAWLSSAATGQTTFVHPASEQAHARAERAAVELAQILVATDLVAACPQTVRTLGDVSANQLMADSIAWVIARSDLRFADFDAAAQAYSVATLARLKRQVLIRDGAPMTKGRALCFYALRIAGGTHPVGRYLERP